MTEARSVTATFAVSDALITVNPARLFDSREGAGPRSPGSITEVQIAGTGTVPLGATGAVLNVTAVNARAPGFLSVFPCGTPVPDASNLNYATGQTIPNAVFARLGTDGRVCIYTFAAADLIVDVNGYVPDSSDVTAVAPVRFYDSRTGDGPRPDGSVTAITVAGRPGYPPNPTAVTLNVTAVDAKTAGFMTMFPCGSPIPEASNLNFAAGQTIANAVVARVGSNGQVCVYVSGSAGLIVDVNGFVPAGSNLTALIPARLFDSRSSGGARTPNSVTEVQVAGLGGVPDPSQDGHAERHRRPGVIGRIHDRVPVRNSGADRVEPELCGRPDDRQRRRGEDRRRRPSVHLHVVGSPPDRRRQRQRTLTRRSAPRGGSRSANDDDADDPGDAG